MSGVVNVVARVVGRGRSALRSYFDYARCERASPTGEPSPLDPLSLRALRKRGG